MMRIKDTRRQFNVSNKRLHRARMLYARLTMTKWYSLEPGLERDSWINQIAAGAIYRGLWKEQGKRRRDGSLSSRSLVNVRYSLCRKWCLMTPGYDNDWFRWLNDNRVRCYFYVSYPSGIKVVA